MSYSKLNGLTDLVTKIIYIKLHFKRGKYYSSCSLTPAQLYAYLDDESLILLIRNR